MFSGSHAHIGYKSRTMLFCFCMLWSAITVTTPLPPSSGPFQQPFVITPPQPWYNQPHFEVSTASELDSKILLACAGTALLGAILLTQKIAGTPAALFLTSLCSTGISAAYGIWRLMLDNDIESVLSHRFASAYNGPLPRTPEFIELLQAWRRATGFFDWLLQRRTVLENCMLIKLVIAQSSNGDAIAEQFNCTVSPHSFTFIPKSQDHESLLKSMGKWFYSHTTYLGEQHHKSKTLSLLLSLLYLIGKHEQLYQATRFIQINSSFETTVSTMTHEKTTEHMIIHTQQERIDIETKRPENVVTFYPPISISCCEKNMVNDYLRANGLIPLEPLSFIQR